MRCMKRPLVGAIAMAAVLAGVAACSEQEKAEKPPAEQEGMSGMTGQQEGMGGMSGMSGQQEGMGGMSGMSGQQEGMGGMSGMSGQQEGMGGMSGMSGQQPGPQAPQQ